MVECDRSGQYFSLMQPTSLLIVDDEQAQRQLLAGFLTHKGYTVVEAQNGAEALERYQTSFAPAAVIDMKMPGMTGLELLARLREINPFVQVIMLTAFGSVETAVVAMRAGAYDYVTKPVEDLDELLLKIEKAVSQNRLITENAFLRERLSEVFPQSSELIGQSPALQRVRDLISAAGPREATVLITGPSGVGKELVARALHAVSPRSGGRLVAINCAAFPETLLEAELFGYERGAFTGADKAKQGRFELAHGGTLFLDEIGEMPLNMQVKLLRVIEERKTLRLGAVKELALDFRLIAATNRELEKAVAEKKFRADLYYRVNIFPIDIPPLRERRDDIPRLLRHFVDKYSRRMGKTIDSIPSETMEALCRYAWPGNIRELQNLMERAVLLSSGPSLRVPLTEILLSLNLNAAPGANILEQSEREQILRALRKSNWVVGGPKGAAALLGLKRTSLAYKMQRLGISRSSE